MHQAPRQRLLVVLLEVGKKGMVRQVLQARGVVGHDVGLPWDVLGDVAVTVVPLVIAG